MSEWGCLTSMESSKTLKPNSDSLPKVPKLLPPIETKVVNEVDPETREKRYDLCKACPFFLDIHKMCRKCGCPMEEKTWRPEASCPIGKW